MEDVDEEDSNEQPDDDGEGGPDEGVDGARVRLQSAEKHQDGQLDEG